jgi:hypothetical protein
MRSLPLTFQKYCIAFVWFGGLQHKHKHGRGDYHSDDDYPHNRDSYPHRACATCAKSVSEKH